MIKRYVAPTLPEAMSKIVSELGREALVLETKNIKKGGFLGFFATRMVEVTATLPTSMKKDTSVSDQVMQKSFQSHEDLKQDMAGLRVMMSQMMSRVTGDKGATLMGAGRQVFDELIARGVSEDVAVDFGRAVADLALKGGQLPEVIRAEVLKAVAPLKPITVLPGQRKVIALIGPTGVGKTTTLAKLAAKFSLEQGAKVGLITSDTFRVAAIEQLRTYAEIMGIPFFAVDTPGQIAEALRETVDCDLVLVDTGGRSHRDADRMRELKEILATIRADEVHLVLSLTTGPLDLSAAIGHYVPLGVNHLAFTKIDEATAPGTILNLRKQCQLPISFVTNGQRVPEDIVPADRYDFGKILLGV